MARQHYTLLCTVLIAIGIRLTIGYKDKESIRNTHGEIPCLSVGGLCVLSTDCPKGKQAPNKGLCPLQQRNGVECCYSQPISETRCQKNGGECIQKNLQCPENLTFFRATDCGKYEKCCILVN